MGLFNVFASSSTGLAANRKWSEVTAQNIANANNEGYTKKDVQFSSYALNGVGSGVYVSQIQREFDNSLSRMYRYEVSKMQADQTIFEGIEEYTAFLGQPDDEQSPASRLGSFEESWLTLVNNPGDQGVQRTVVNSAQDMVNSLRDTASNLDQIRNEVEAEIKYEVADVNEILNRVADLNKQAIRTGGETMRSAEIQDELHLMIDNLSKSMDIKTGTGPEGTISLFTSGGTPLVEGQYVETVAYNQGTGQLMAGNVNITPNGSGNRSFDHGNIGGLFNLKTEIIPRFQLQLDEMAKTLIQNFENSDASLAPGQAGLFTDGGSAAAFNPANLDGLASRISLNSAVVPEEGGALFRIRDGMGAATPGSHSDSTQVRAFIDSFDAAGSYDPATQITATLNIRDYASNMVSHQQTERTSAEKSYSVSRTSAQAIDTSRQSVQGVNIDDELQKLVLIEQSYAANSQVIKTAMTLMDTLLSIA